MAGVFSMQLERIRDNRQSLRDERQRAHDVRERRYGDRKAAYENFLGSLTGAERSALELEEHSGLLPGDHGYPEEIRSVDQALAGLHFVASSGPLKLAEKCTHAFYAWAYRGKQYGALVDSRASFIEAVRIDLGIDKP